VTTFREEFIVCYAAGYPDPFQCDTLKDARSFARRHSFDHSKMQAVKPVIKRRLVSDYEDIEPKREKNQ
jgi:hypothetical protein